VEVPGATEGRELLFVLEPAASVSGTVLDNFGTPIGGATVTRQVPLAEAIVNRGREPVSTTSDARGRFHLGGLDPGGHALLARREGFAASEPVPVELVAGGVVEDVVLELRLGGLLTGEVFDDEGEPAPGRMVIVRSNGDPLDQRLLPTDASGEFRVEHLEPGGYQVIATVNFMTEDLDTSDSGGLGELLGSMKMTAADIVEGEETHVVLGAPPEDPVTLVGRVVHAGEPVPGVMVSLIPEEGRGLGEMKLRTADAEGAFTVELERRGPYLVTVQKVVGAGMQNSIEFHETIPAEGERHELVLGLPVGRISGRIVGPDGKPVADCRVTLGSEGGVPLGSLLGGNYADLTSDATGRYDIPYLRPGTYSVSAGGVVLGGMLGEGSSLGRVVRAGLRVGEGEWLDDVDFELEEPGELAGRVFSLEGTPAAGAAVFVRDEAGRLLERFSMVVTDAAGSFTYPGLAPGSYTFTAMHGSDVSPPSEHIRVTSGGRGEGRVTLEGGTMLEIEVVDKSGEEVRARVSVLDEDERELAGMLSLPEIQARLGEGLAQDALRVGPLSPGKYRVSAILEDGRESYKRVTLSGDRETRKVVLRMK